jgi:hypothetical protein
VDLSCSKAIKRSNNCYRAIANWAAVFRSAKRSLLADFVVKVGGREARALARFLENGLW